MDWGLSAFRHAGALLEFSMSPRGTTSPGVTWTAPAMGRGSLSPGETAQTRAVNQNARTMTPRRKLELSCW